MFEVIPDCGGPHPDDSWNPMASAITTIHSNNMGIRCPHGCKGSASRLFGLVRHLMDVHGYTEKAAWTTAKQRPLFDGKE